MSENGITRIKQMSDDDIARINQMSENGITRIKQMSKDDITQISQMSKDGVTRISQMSENGITRIKQMSDDDIARINQMSEDGIIQISQMLEKDITRIYQMSDDDIARINQMSKDGIIQISQMSKRDITQINQMSKNDITRIKQMSKDDITRINQMSKDAISQKKPDSQKPDLQKLQKLQKKLQQSKLNQGVVKQTEIEIKRLEIKIKHEMIKDAPEHNRWFGQSVSAENDFRRDAIQQVDHSLFPRGLPTEAMARPWVFTTLMWVVLGSLLGDIVIYCFMVYAVWDNPTKPAKAEWLDESSILNSSGFFGKWFLVVRILMVLVSFWDGHYRDSQHCNDSHQLDYALNRVIIVRSLFYTYLQKWTVFTLAVMQVVAQTSNNFSRSGAPYLEILQWFHDSDLMTSVIIPIFILTANSMWVPAIAVRTTMKNYSFQVLGKVPYSSFSRCRLVLSACPCLYLQDSGYSSASYRQTFLSSN
jgi:hypothetical protein